MQGIWQCENEIGIAKLTLRKFRIAKLVLRNFRIANFRIAKFSHCECGIAKIFALRNYIWHLALRNAQWPAATVPLLLNPAASHPVSTASHFLHFSFVFLLIYGLFDG